MNKRIIVLLVGIFFSLSAFAHEFDSAPGQEKFFVKIAAKNRTQRTSLLNYGVAIDRVMSDCIYGTATPKVIERLKSKNIPIQEVFKLGEKIGMEEFPGGDERFHDYKEMTESLEAIVKSNPKMFRMFSIGKTLEGRDIWAVQINSSPTKNQDGKRGWFSSKPGIVFMGNHHAREHVSAEIPLMTLEFLAKNYGKDPEITNLMETRDIYYIPMVNPDGVEYDISSAKYKMQRKNMRKNDDGSIGVDLNRNYSFMWGTGGSSKDPDSETYMGTEPFSENESKAIKAFVEARPNLRVLLSFHTYSELILYPWGHKYEPIADEKELKTYENMARTMAKWNGYTPQQSSDLYIASGDTTDWSYGAHKIFSFTFELSPKDMWSGGFYPGAKILDRVFAANLKPQLYLIDLADDPYRAVGTDEERRPYWLR